MTKLNLTLLLMVFIASTSVSTGQIKPSELLGSWVITNLTFKDGAPFPDENPLKYTFVKYTFAEGNKMYSSTKAHVRGAMTYYQIKKDQLIINNLSGQIINNFLISKRGTDTLSIIRKGPKGFGDPDALLYTFVKEGVVQKSKSALQTIDLIRPGLDTVFSESASLYANFQNPEGFENYALDDLKDKAGEQGTGLFRMSFIVDKNGIVDSVKIIRGIWKAFDDMYLKAFTKVKSKWKPALINGRPVSVRMFVEARFVASAMIEPSNVYTRQGDGFYNNGKFDVAIQYFEAALKNYPDSETTLYKRGICKLRLDDIDGGLADLRAVKDMRGNLQVDELISQYKK